MPKKNWRFDLEGSQHTIKLRHATHSGKRRIYIDGELRKQYQIFPDSGSVDSFQIDGHEAAVLIRPDGPLGVSFHYDLLIDDTS